MPEAHAAAIDLSGLLAWLGRQETRDDVIGGSPLQGLAATLDHPAVSADIGAPLPSLWHWLYFLPVPAASDIDVDGHAMRGGFLPPVPLPRRMWAGSSIRFISPLQVGDAVRRVSTIADINHKTGSNGDLVFVTVRHQILRKETLALEEDQQLVYRAQGDDQAVPRCRPAPAVAQWSRDIRPDPVLLFRYSALTFNSHRIHYDRDYATQTEGYAGLVVQGPLTATLLLDLLHAKLPGECLASFRFRGVMPLLDTGPVRLQGRRDGGFVRLWALDASGSLAMEAHAELA